MTDFSGPPKLEPSADDQHASDRPGSTPEPGPAPEPGQAPDSEPQPATTPAPGLEPLLAPPLVPDLTPPGPPPGPPPPSVETTRRLLGASFDLLTRASDDMRRASFYIGLIVLVTAAPAALALMAVESVSIHKTDSEMARLERAGVESWEYLLIGLAGLGVGVAAIESRIMAATILGGHVAGKPVTTRRAVARSRMTFWYVGIAAFIAFIPATITEGLLGGAFEAVLGAQVDVSLVTSVIVAVLVGAPLAYLLTGIVLGDVGPLEATGRSIRVFRARKLAAILIAIFETTALLLVVLGLGVGFDLALRVFDGLGLSLDAGPAGLVLIALGLIVGSFALGTLIYTALALSIAPQVVMFVGLTRATFGLDHVRPGGDRDPDAPRAGARPFHWLTWPMRIGFGFGVLGLVAIVSLLGR